MPHVGNFPKPEYPRPLSIGPPAFVPSEDTYDWDLSSSVLNNRSSLALQKFYAPVFLPHGATVTKLKLNGYRTSTGSALKLTLGKNAPEGETLTMASLLADWSDGHGSIETTTIGDAKIDNEAYSYSLEIRLDPDASILDVAFGRVVIDWN